MVYDALEFDLVLRSPRYLHLVNPRGFSRNRLYQAASMPTLRWVSPLYLASQYWRNPHTGQKRLILTLGVEPGTPALRFEEMRRKSELLGSAEFVLVDRQSRGDFGPQQGERFSDADVGSEAELARQRVRIVGHFSLGTGFAADGAVLLSEQGYCRINAQQPPREVNLGLVKLQHPADPQAAAAQLRTLLDEDVEVLTRAEVVDFEVNHWVNETSLGVIFQLGVGLALVVGTAIVYLVLSSDVAHHMADYSTLMAVGYGHRFLAGVVLQQALALALLGFLPGVLIAEVLYRLTGYQANLPVEMTWRRVVFVLLLSVVMCTVSGLGALRKLRSADPADLF